MEGDGKTMKKPSFEETLRLFKLFADRTRLRIIDLLAEDEHCVQDICETLSLEQSTVSHQLRMLREENVVRRKRRGKQIFYTLKDAHILAIYHMARSHAEECDD